MNKITLPDGRALELEAWKDWGTTMTLNGYEERQVPRRNNAALIQAVSVTPLYVVARADKEPLIHFTSQATREAAFDRIEMPVRFFTEESLARGAARFVTAVRQMYKEGNASVSEEWLEVALQQWLRGPYRLRVAMLIDYDHELTVQITNGDHDDRYRIDFFGMARS